MHGGLYEQSDKKLEEDHNLTSKRQHSEMREKLDKHEERELRYDEQTSPYVRHNRRKISVVKEDGDSIVRTGPTTTLNYVEWTLSHIYEERRCTVG